MTTMMISPEDMKCIKDAVATTKKKWPYLDHEDILSMAWILYLKATENYNQDKGNRNQWLYWKVYQGILDELRNEYSLRRKVQVNFTQLSVRQVSKYDRHDYQNDCDYKLDIKELIDNVLTERERDVCISHESGEILKSIGARHGISESRACQIYNDCIRRLREYVTRTNTFGE